MDELLSQLGPMAGFAYRMSLQKERFGPSPETWTKSTQWHSLPTGSYLSLLEGLTPGQTRFASFGFAMARRSLPAQGSQTVHRVCAFPRMGRGSPLERQTRRLPGMRVATST